MNGNLNLDMRKLSMYRDGSRTLLSSRCPDRCDICLDADLVRQYRAKVTELTSAGPPHVNDVGGALGVVTIILVVIGLMFAVGVTYYIYSFASHKIFNICVDAHVCIILGTVLQLGSSFVFLFSPTPLVCAIQQAIPGMKVKVVEIIYQYTCTFNYVFV